MKKKAKKKKKAIGFIRARKFNHVFTPDFQLQKVQIEKFAKENEYDLVKVVWETGNETRVFNSARRYCREKNVVFLYVDIGNWNATTEFKRQLNQDLAAVKEGKGYWTPISIPAEKRTLEVIERHARKERVFANVGKFGSDKTVPRKQKGQSIAETEIMKWKKNHKIGTKRFKNFYHLYRGIEPIYTLFREQVGEFSDRQMAQNLNYHFYLTVDGKRWNKHNVRKTRELTDTSNFHDFCLLMDKWVKD